MNQNERDYVLGDNVTEQAKAQENRSTVVVSFRVSESDFDRLSSLAVSQGKTISQIAREALQKGIASTARTTRMGGAISFVGGNMVSFGSMTVGTFCTGESQATPMHITAERSRTIP